MTSNTNRGHILCRGGDQGGCGEAEERGNARNQASQVGAAHQERAVTMSANGVTVCYERLKDCPICLLIKDIFYLAITFPSGREFIRVVYCWLRLCSTKDN